jgi:hypothetical protein
MRIAVIRRVLVSVETPLEVTLLIAVSFLTVALEPKAELLALTNLVVKPLAD